MNNIRIFVALKYKNRNNMNYIKVSEAATKRGISARRVRLLCEQGITVLYSRSFKTRIVV